MKIKSNTERYDYSAYDERRIQGIATTILDWLKDRSSSLQWMSVGEIASAMETSYQHPLCRVTAALKRLRNSQRVEVMRVPRTKRGRPCFLYRTLNHVPD